MATSTFPATGGFVDNTSAATFVPEIWSDEIRAAYEKNLILANLVKKMSMSGKKGDTIHVLLLSVAQHTLKQKTLL